MNNCVRDEEIEVWRGEAICPWSNWQRASRVRLWKPCFMMLSHLCELTFFISSGRTSYMRRTTTWRLTKWYISWMCLSVILLGLSGLFQTLLHVQITWNLMNADSWIQQVGEAWVGPKMHITNKLPSECYCYWSMNVLIVRDRHSIYKGLAHIWSPILTQPCEVTIIISTLEMRTLRVWLEIITIFKCQLFL